ncbi:hypothetical protein BST27_06855 [Mycobacterium intermedium]|uniref:Uncharacterized protein n=1 Tax=Mycobacterium intermedium TaxID=28445 RepID=A0A1E3SKH0_MYCIE|nr:hypothetical protein [Mycobacterium intermedium]MCV6967230.1 hypothetical protein [Mycobacterium intermedium]ODR02048.1 hypothetical protein BHQ20_06445 [Mycobacterium intermedium]OPE50217.1 hypothetical protein BV508_11045 [Mycobacterium intermedium]ORB08997.1 hypothetical protein BST27_06855 [Mycobacterium intermedium]
MSDTGGEFRDDVPLADAVEQQRPGVDSPFDEEESSLPAETDEIGLETSVPDWQEQQQVVPVDPDLDGPDQF